MPIRRREPSRRACARVTQRRLLAAADLQETESAIGRFNGVLALSLAVLLVLLSAAAVAPVAVGLAPLRSLQHALAAVHAGRVQRLAGRFPAEIQPLIDDFNRVLDRDAGARLYSIAARAWMSRSRAAGWNSRSWMNWSTSMAHG